MAQAAVSKLSPAVGAGHAAFYFPDGDGRYSLLASYGYRERKHLNNCFAIGEGLVGQAVMEKTPITLTAPKDYIRINSGLGEGPPACISVMPVIMGERVLGVLEMASFQAFSEREQALMDALLPVLATTPEILDRNMKTKELLTATQKQAERMEKQAAQLEEQTVEMEAQQAELLETETWFRSIIESALDGILVIEESGRILMSNPQAEAIFGYASSEMVGMDVESLMSKEARFLHREQRQKFLEAGKNREMASHRSIQILRKDGKESTVRIALNVLPSRGNRGRCVSASIRAIAA
ncbi:MAG: PAS domain S-box protein [Magnetococcus sp. YQC-9]